MDLDRASRQVQTLGDAGCRSSVRVIAMLFELDTSSVDLATATDAIVTHQPGSRAS